MIHSLSFEARVASHAEMVRKIVTFLAVFLFASSAWADTQPTRIFAAASLRGPLDAALEDWAGEVSISYGGSGAIARQVTQGAKADLVLLANPEWDTWLSERQPGLAMQDALLGNRLVLIGPKDAAPFDAPPSKDDLAERLGSGRLAMGQHQAVPAGAYAQDWLEHIGAWGALALAEAQNVRLALAFVARGLAPLGIVYATDAASSDTVRVLWAIPEDTHAPIRYPARAMSAEGASLLMYLEGEIAGAAFERAGFIHLPERIP